MDNHASDTDASSVGSANSKMNTLLAAVEIACESSMPAILSLTTNSAATASAPVDAAPSIPMAIPVSSSASHASHAVSATYSTVHAASSSSSAAMSCPSDRASPVTASPTSATAPLAWGAATAAAVASASASAAAAAKAARGKAAPGGRKARGKRAHSTTSTDGGDSDHSSVNMVQAQLRRLRNRKSAAESRRRKRQMVDRLEKRVAVLSTSQFAMRTELSDLAERHTELRSREQQLLAALRARVQAMQ